MLTNKILIPVIENKDNILDDDMAMIKDEYVIVKDKKNPNILYLFPKEFFLEDSYFYNIFDLSAHMAKEYGNDTVYVILEENDEGNINYVIGNGKYMDKKYHTKGVVLKNKWKTESEILLKMLSFVLNVITPKKIVVFELSNNKIVNEISKKISENFEKEYFIEKYDRKKFIKTLSKIKAHEKTEQIIVPYVVGAVVSALIFGGSVFLVNYKNKIENEKAQSKIEIYKTSILNSKKKYYDLNKTYAQKLEILKQLESKKIYKGN